MQRLSIYAHLGGAPHIESKRVITRINQVSRMAREAGAPIVIIQHESQDGPLDYGSEGWNVARGLEALPTDIHVRKSFGPKVRAVPASEVRIEV